LDLLTNELTWSDEVYRIFGLKPQEFAATYEAFLEHVHPDDRAAVNEAYSQSIQAGTDEYEIEHRLVRKSSGEIRFVHEKCRHTRDEEGRIIRSLGMVLDVTERKKAQEALERSNRELEQFAYVASHDLQEPLRSIVGFLQLFQRRYEDKVDEKGRHYIERSVKAAHRMQTLIRELLTLSRVHSKGSTFLPTDLNLLFQGVLENLQATVLEKNAQITCEKLPTLSIDAGQIRSLFQNLLLNALRYNENPRPLVDIGYQEIDDSYRFQVQDNGIGISPQFHQRIFVVFQRLHSEMEYPGTGLGLALCRKIAERHGGTMWVESNPTGGSIFYFTLPKDI
jgi:PAS domain S-box-containing protein